MNTEKPLPAVSDPDAAPYWAAAKQRRLSLQQCAQCRSVLYPPGPSCPRCGSLDIPYLDLGERITGQVYSYIVPHRAFVAGFGDEAPYVVALVELDQAPGVRILANLLNCPHDRVSIGMRVRMTWEDRTAEVALPQWEPAT